MPRAPEIDARRRDPAVLEARLARLEQMRADRLVARKRLRLAIAGAGLALVVAVVAGSTVIDLSAGGMSPRSPIFWLVGLVGLAALPALYLALRPAEASGEAEAQLGAAELDLVIRHVKDDLVKSRLVAPAQSLQIVESSAEGGLSAATGAPEGSLAEPER